MNRLHYFITESINWYYNGLSESIFIFLVFFSRENRIFDLIFVHYSVIQLRYFWWNWLLNSFSLLVGLLRLVCLLMMVGTYSSWSVIIDQQNVGARYIFWWNMFFNNSIYIASHGAAINFLFWTASFFFFCRLFYLSTRFLSVLTLESSPIY